VTTGWRNGRPGNKSRDFAKFCGANHAGKRHAHPVKSQNRIDPRWSWHHRALLAARRRLSQLRDGSRLDLALTERDQNAEAIRGDRVNDDEVAVAELKIEEGELAEIEGALERLQQGTYGLCVRTGRPISAARLRAMPWTPYARDVARQIDPCRHRAR
jgi:RNA polymerase-binding transcription factor DksA